MSYFLRFLLGMGLGLAGITASALLTRFLLSLAMCPA